MTDIRIEPVDERDGAWEDHGPRFRVYLHGGQGEATMGWTDTYDVTGADLLRTIDWAQRQAGDSLTYAIALVVDGRFGSDGTPDRSRGLAWLIGMDGMDSPGDESEGVVLRRMLARRDHPVILPLQSQRTDSRFSNCRQRLSRCSKYVTAPGEQLCTNRCRSLQRVISGTTTWRWHLQAEHRDFIII